MAEKTPQYLHRKKSSIYWDWWRENPTEIVLVIFIITLFALTPWAGCGVSEADISAAEIQVIP